MRALAAGILAGVLLIAPVSVDAWGLDVHRWITGRALAALPEPLKAFYASRAAMVGGNSKVWGITSDWLRRVVAQIPEVAQIWVEFA